MLVRSVRTSHVCIFQDVWKWKSARPTTSRKSGYAPDNHLETLGFPYKNHFSVLPVRCHAWWSIESSFQSRSHVHLSWRTLQAHFGLSCEPAWCRRLGPSFQNRALWGRGRETKDVAHNLLSSSNSMTFHYFFKFSMTSSLAVTFKIVLILAYFFYLKQFNRYKLWCLPKSVPLALFNWFSQSYIVLALSSAVTTLPNKIVNFPWLSTTDN